MSYDLGRAREGLSLRARLDHLLSCLEEMRQRFKDGVALVMGRSVATAVQDLLRLLLGVPADTATADAGAGWGGSPQKERWAETGSDDRYWNGEQNDPWHDEEDDPWRDEPPREDEPARGWLSGLGALLLAALSWLGPLASWAGTLLA